MTILAHFRAWQARRDLDRRLSARKAIRIARANAAHRGVSTYWKRAGDRCRAMFGTGA